MAGLMSDTKFTPGPWMFKAHDCGTRLLSDGTCPMCEASEIITARERLLDQWNEKLDGLRKELAQKEQALAASQARLGELQEILRRWKNTHSCGTPNAGAYVCAVCADTNAALAAPDGQKEK